MIKKIFLLILSLFILWGAGGQVWAQTEELLTATVTTYSWDNDNKLPGIMMAVKAIYVTKCL